MNKSKIPWEWWIKSISKDIHEANKDLKELSKWLWDSFSLIEIIKNKVEEIVKDNKVVSYLKDKWYINIPLLIWETLKNITNCLSITENNKKKLNTIKKKVEKAESYIQAYYECNNKDCLMKTIYNRRFFDMEIKRFIETDKDFSLIFLDLDEFKPINDKYWHVVWDDYLRKFAWDLLETFWNEDNKMFRYWWDEFVIIFWGNFTDIVVKINLFKKWLSNRKFVFKDKSEEKKLEIWFSFWYTKRLTNDSVNKIIKRADLEMYKNKESKKHN